MQKFTTTVELEVPSKIEEALLEEAVEEAERSCIDVMVGDPIEKPVELHWLKIGPGHYRAADYQVLRGNDKKWFVGNPHGTGERFSSAAKAQESIKATKTVREITFVWDAADLYDLRDEVSEVENAFVSYGFDHFSLDRPMPLGPKRTTGAERMDPGFAVFNLHVNKGGERADAEFIAQFGQDTFDAHIAPLHESGIMSILGADPKPEHVAWVTLCTAFVNEGR